MQIIQDCVHHGFHLEITLRTRDTSAHKLMSENLALTREARNLIVECGKNICRLLAQEEVCLSQSKESDLVASQKS